MFKRLLLSTLLSALHLSGRTTYSINESWRFLRDDVADASEIKFDDSSWEVVSIPHTWNAKDAIDEKPGFYRGVGWYRRIVHLNAPLEERRVYIKFDGANQETELFVNGESVDSHIGGYSAFCFDITDFVLQGENIFAVKVDNKHNPDIPPLSADFTFFGGIYRDVNIIITSERHISTTHYATNGVYIRTPHVDRNEAIVEIETLVTNASDKKSELIINSDIVSPSGETMYSVRKPITLDANSVNTSIKNSVKIPNPELWDIESPKLYKVRTTLLDANNKVIDETSNSMGLRWYSFHPERGFFLNGEYRKLMGTCRHQDYLNKGNALRDEMHVRDVELLKEMGGNFLRVAHYPQDDVVMQKCDALGIVTSVEIPIINAITMSAEFNDNSLEMIREMVYQNHNSPSVVMWTYMNEVLLRPPYNHRDQDEKREYMDFLYGVASNIEKELRSLDEERYTMLPCHGNINIYRESGITSLPMILGWNLYNGWYSDNLEGFERTLEELHKTFPEQPIIVSEYGADVDQRLHSFEPERFDYTAEYGILYHRHYIREILKRDYVVGANIWNLNDFYSEVRGNAVPNTNKKGITGLDRAKKGSYYLYQANLLDSPVLKIDNHDWIVRGGVGDENHQCTQPVEVFTNANSVELFLNNKSLGVADVIEKTAYFDVPFANGANRLEAVANIKGETKRDILDVEFKMIPNDLNDEIVPFKEINVMLGSKRYFEDRDANMVWLPEQEYKEGSWGYIGGAASHAPTAHGSLPASDVDVLGTTQDPIFQTQRGGIEEFRADVPDGKYYIYLYWAELTTENPREVVYNLGNDPLAQKAERRLFNVLINDKIQLHELNPAVEFGEHRAAIKKFEVDVYDGEGISVKFDKIVGEPILNAIRIYRCF